MQNVYSDSKCPRLTLHCCHVFAAYQPPHLMLYSENDVFVYNVVQNEWIQSLPLKRVSHLLLEIIFFF